MGAVCRPKYFGARKLSVRLGENQEFVFFWQNSYSEYFASCLSKGLFSVFDPEQHDWIKVLSNKAAVTIYPNTEQIYS